MIDDFKEQTGSALRQSSLAAAAALSLFITTSFLCAAAFVVVLEKYGLMQACLAGAALFFIVTMIAAGSYMVRKHQIEVRARERAQGRGALRASQQPRRSHGGRNGPPGDPRHRYQTPDSDPRCRWAGTGISRQPSHCR